MNTDLDWVTMSMAQLITMHMELGSLYGRAGWAECFEKHSKSGTLETITSKIGITEHLILNLKEQLSQLLIEEHFDMLLLECKNTLESSCETKEQEIEKEYRPPGIFFKKDALIILTEVTIPEDIQIALSFGYKFLFPFECNNKNMNEILAQLEMCMHDAIPDLQQLEASMDIYRILRNRKDFLNDDTKAWLKFISNRTSTFFERNPHIFATKSDKGGHTVVADVVSYEDKLTKLLTSNSYTELNHDPLLDLITQDKMFHSALKGNEKTKELFDGLPLYEPDTFCLAKFYGLFKIHKEDIPLRPITSTIGSPGYMLAKMLTKMLEIIFPRTKHHIKDSYEFVKFLRRVRIREDDILVSFDVVSMYTSIPYELVEEIILSKADAFFQIYNIDAVLLQRLIKYLLVDCMIFTALDKTYKQNDGLPMGSCASPILARIVMDRVINDLLEKVPHFSFIKVFVDDTIAAVDKQHFDKALQVLNDFRPGQIKFTRELESEHASINFLNTTLLRRGNKVEYCWHRKGFYSGRLLPYYSSHKRTTVMSTAKHFILTVLQLSDPSFFHTNKPIVERTLRENSFPESTILVLMNNYYTLMRCNTKESDTDNKSAVKEKKNLRIITEEDEKEGYVIFPHSMCEGRRIKRVITHLKAPRVILTDSVRNTKVNSVTTRKTITPIAKRRNLILISRCQCKKRYKIVRTKVNETGEMASRGVITKFSACNRYAHAYKKVRFRRGLFYASQTDYLWRYIQWQYRRQLDVSQCRYEWPNSRLRKLIE